MFGRKFIFRVNIGEKKIRQKTKQKKKKNKQNTKIEMTMVSDKIWLTHLSPASHKRDIGKQCRPRSDAEERGVWSESTLFALTSLRNVYITW